MSKEEYVLQKSEPESDVVAHADVVTHVDVVAKQMWWLIGSAPDFCGRSPGFESAFYHNDPDGLRDHCVILKKNLRVEGETST